MLLWTREHLQGRVNRRAMITAIPKSNGNISLSNSRMYLFCIQIHTMSWFVVAAKAIFYKTQCTENMNTQQKLKSDLLQVSITNTYTLVLPQAGVPNKTTRNVKMQNCILVRLVKTSFASSKNSERQNKPLKMGMSLAVEVLSTFFYSWQKFSNWKSVSYFLNFLFNWRFF